jgi:hypothetical protein
MARPQVASLDRVFFSAAGLWFIALALTGFWRTFYYRTLPEPLPNYQIIHGVVYSSWVCLFLVQALLISTNAVRWHRVLGTVSVLLLLLMIPVGFRVVLEKTAAGIKSVDEAGFNLSELTLGFVLAFAGLAMRKRPLIHKRLMLLATVTLTVAAADRASIVLGFADVRALRKCLALAPAIALVGYDALWCRRALLFTISLSALVWLVVWFIISDVVFLRPEGEAIIRILTKVFVQ